MSSKERKSLQLLFAAVAADGDRISSVDFFRVWKLLKLYPAFVPFDQLKKIVLKDPLYWKKRKLNFQDDYNTSSNVSEMYTLDWGFSLILIKLNQMNFNVQCIEINLLRFEGIYLRIWDHEVTSINEWETTVDKVIMANGNDLFVKNVDKVRQTFYQAEGGLRESTSILIKGTCSWC